MFLGYADFLALAVLLLGVIAYYTYKAAQYAKMCVAELSMARWEQGCRAGGLRTQPEQYRDRVQL